MIKCWNHFTSGKWNMAPMAHGRVFAHRPWLWHSLNISCQFIDCYILHQYVCGMYLVGSVNPNLPIKSFLLQLRGMIGSVGEDVDIFVLKLDSHTWNYSSEAFMTNIVECCYTRSNIIRYYIGNYRNWNRISIRYWFHKRHPIARHLWASYGMSFMNISAKIDPL